VTGNGLKDVQSAMRAAGEARRIEPTVQDLERAVRDCVTRGAGRVLPDA
jgi:hypothetical protein